MTLCETTKKVLMINDVSIDARAVLLYMVYNRQIDHVKAIMQHLCIQKTRAYRILNELIEQGYVKRGIREECRYKPLSLTRKTLRMIS